MWCRHFFWALILGEIQYGLQDVCLLSVYWVPQQKTTPVKKNSISAIAANFLLKLIDFTVEDSSHICSKISYNLSFD